MAQHLHLTAPKFAAWNKGCMRVIQATEPAAIADALTDALKIVLDFDGLFLAALHRDAPPSVPYYNDPREPELKYHDGPYLLDPFYNSFLAGKADGCYRLAELAPEGFLRSEYFASYYHLLDFSDELGLLASLDTDASAHLSVIRRRGRPRFNRRDHDWLEAAAPLVREAVRRMHETQHPAPNDRSGLHESLRQAYRHFGASTLTDREREVVQLLLRGNSAKAIARVLTISPETARNHLKRIYPKLGVASQAELFALFFKALEQVEPGFEGDPLTRLR
ncbi:helix-turn-helix transcriptional regulator [Dongia deserti]|uniref:helix-turn-helix transcriptional regulator n=1 Tax=Dongia deserti TaxID=2268030 RepID=UPI0013C4667C|nr:helix-turn-helix transcriptional regulator [Dongia deserti]